MQERIYNSTLIEKNPKSVIRHLNLDIEEIRHSLRNLMWRRVGIIRCEKSLREAQKKIEGWSFILKEQFLARRELELKNMLIVAQLIIKAALLRKGSIGAHYRSDFPQRGELGRKHIILRNGEEPHYDFIE